MVPTIDARSNAINHNEDEPYTLILGLKELTLLTIILFIGFCGFTFSVKKILNTPIQAEQHKDIRVYEKEQSQAYISINTLDLGN